MSASSQYRKVAETQKVKKVERRNAAIKRYESENDIVKHIKVEARGVPAETVSSDSVIDSGEIKAKPKTPKIKSDAGKKRGSGKKVFSNRKAAKI